MNNSSILFENKWKTLDTPVLLADFIQAVTSTISEVIFVVTMVLRFVQVCLISHIAMSHPVSDRTDMEEE